MTDLSTILKNAQNIRDLVEAAKMVVETVILAQPFVAPVISKVGGVVTAVLGREEDTLHDKSDVAILVQISRPAYVDVKTFLASSGVDVPLFVISNDEGTLDGQPIDDHNPSEWAAVARAFAEQIHEIQRVYGSKQYHLFIAAPSALAFALGTTVGSLYPIRLYNYVRGETDAASKYAPVINVPKDVSRKTS